MDKALILKEIKNYLGYKKDGDFADFLGIKQNTLSNWKSRNTIDYDLIVSKCENIDANWLITGKGEMLKGDTAIQKHTLYTDVVIDDVQRIPLFNMEATASFVEILDKSPELKADQYLSIPNLPKCDGAIHVTGDSMYPLIKSGDIAIYKEIKNIENNIFWGEMYLISLNVDDEYYTTIKYIQKSEKGESYVKLVSQNRHHGDKDVLLARVKAIALVKATVRFNVMG